MARWWAAFIGNKQVNGRALLILILVSVVGLGGTYLVHGFQVRRNAGGLLEQAELTEGDANKIQAIMYLEQYLGLMPGDSEATAKLALMLTQQTGNKRAQRRAYLLIDDLLRRNAIAGADERRRLRREAATLAIGFGRYAEAKEQLAELINDNNQDANPQTLHLEGLAEAGLGNDASAKTLLERAWDKSEDPAMALDLATLLRERLRQPAEAGRVIDEMVGKNGTSASVRLQAARFWGAGEPENAWRYLQPDLDAMLAKSAKPSEETLQLAGEVALALEEDAVARQLFERGRQLYPKNQSISRDLALVKVRSGETAEARAELDPLVNDLPTDVLDLWSLADLLIEAKDKKNARMVTGKIPRTTGGGLVDFLEARMLMGDGKWGEAAEHLESARTDARFSQKIGKRANLFLAQCNEHLLNTDQTLKALQRAVDIDPADGNATAAGRELALAQAAAGDMEPALARLRQLVSASRSPAQRRQLNEDIVQLLINRNRASPASKRNWGEAIDRLLGERTETLVARSLGSAGLPNGCDFGISEMAILLERIDPKPKKSPVNLLSAHILFLRGKFDDARAQAEFERQRHPSEVEPWQFLVSLAEVTQDDAKAAEVLDQAERQLPDKVEWPLMRARLLVQKGPDEARKGLAPLLKVLEHYKKSSDKDRLRAGLADAFSAAGDMATARRLRQEFADDNPNDLQVRFALFEAALGADDLPAATKLLKQMQDIEGTEGAFSAYGEGALLIAQAQAGDKPMAKALADAHPNLVRAAKLRPTWAQPPLLEATAFELEGQKTQALEKFRAALERGERRLSVVKHILELMHDQGLYFEAETLVNNLGEKARSAPELGQVVGATLARSGEQQKALDLARAAAKDSIDAGAYRWLGTIARVTAKSLTGQAQEKLQKDAETAYLRACALKGTDPANWMALLYFLVDTDQKARAAEELTRAERSLAKEQAMLVTAIGADLLDQSSKAEESFKELRARRPNDPQVLRAAATFYSRRGNLALAADILGEMMVGPEVHATPADMAWARVKRALLLALQGGRDKINQANLVLDQASPAEQQAPEYRLTKAQVLAMDPTRGGEAIKILEGLAAQAPPSESTRFLLARLYEANGRKTEALTQLAILAREQKPNPAHLDRYVSLLLLERKTGEAQTWFEKLRQAAPDQLRTKELQIDLLLIAKDANKAKLIDLVDVYRRTTGARLDWAAGWLELLGQNHEAEEAYREYAKASKRPESMLPLALHLAKNNKIAEALAICERAWATAPPEAVARTIATAMRAGEADPAQLKSAEDSLQDAIKKTPGSTTLPFYLAEFYEYQNRNNEAIELYGLLLERDSHNVAALNNRAYLLALARGETAEALKLVNAALDRDPGKEELLDTRAFIYMRRGTKKDAALALRDLSDVVARAPKVATYYFHLAQARVADDDKAGAADAWKKALDLHLTESSLHPLERPAYRDLRGRLK